MDVTGLRDGFFRCGELGLDGLHRFANESPPPIAWNLILEEKFLGGESGKRTLLILAMIPFVLLPELEWLFPLLSARVVIFLKLFIIVRS